MADKIGMERKVWLLPTELSERIQSFQESQGVVSEVAAARFLLDLALQMRDTVDSILRRMTDQFREERNPRALAKNVLTSHDLITEIHFGDDSVWFVLRNGQIGRFDKDGRAFVGERSCGDLIEWTEWPAREVAAEAAD